MQASVAVQRQYGQVLLLHYEATNARLHVATVDVDAESKSVRLNALEVSVALSDRAELVAAQEVEVASLGTRQTFVVLQDTQRRNVATLLFFFVLQSHATDGWRMRFLSQLELPSLATDNSTRVLLADGPFALLCGSELMTILTLSTNGRFVLWRSRVSLGSSHRQVVSCAFVSDVDSTCSHLMLHCCSQQASPSSQSPTAHEWLVYRTEGGPLDTAERCEYLEIPNDERDQVTCCLLLSRLTDSGPDPSYSAWQSEPVDFSLPVVLKNQVLLVVGTASNSIYVYDNGVVLASIVLPSTPSQIWSMGSPGTLKHVYLVVKCSDVNQCLYLLKLERRAGQSTMEILQAFSHVGDAFVGDFHRSLLPMDQLLLLNDTSSPMDDSEQLHTQIVKRCVLLIKKHEAALDSFTCIRLRLRGEEKSKSRKRSRGDATESFRYIERIKSSSRRRAVQDSDIDENQETTASTKQLALLAKSLQFRLDTGLRELRRLELIANEKKIVVRQLDSLLIKQWWHSNHNGQDRPFTTLRSLGYDHSGSSAIALEVLAKARGADDESSTNGRIPGSADQEQVGFECPVVLENFAIVDYVPAASLVRVEVTLRNNSLSALRDVYVGLVCMFEDNNVNDLRCSSSVLPAFVPALHQHDGVGRFSVEVTLPPKYLLLRRQQAVSAMLWLHYAIPEDTGDTKQRPLSESRTHNSIPISSVSISPSAFVREHLQASELLNQAKERFFFREREQILVLSGGTNLMSLLTRQAPPPGFESLVRRTTYALVDLAAGERELSQYYISSLLSTLPHDVYAMLNPLTVEHLRTLRELLALMRAEQLSIQRAASTEPDESNEKQTGQIGDQTTTDAFRLIVLQHRTDLCAVKLQVHLQKRANFHSIWYK